MTSAWYKQPALWLAVSLIANAALAGVVVGGLIRHHDKGTHCRHTSARHALREAMPRQEWRTLRRDLAQAWRGASAERAAIETARAQVAETALADPFDSTALVEALGGLQRNEALLKTRTHRIIAERLADLPPEHRLRVLTLLESARPRRHGRRGPHARKEP